MSSESRRIALLPGDGIGPEVIHAARTVLEEVADLRGLDLTFEEAKIGGAALDDSDSSAAEPKPLPEETLLICENADAVLLGAVGGPRWSDPSAPARPEQGLLDLRRHFELFANLRPVRLFRELQDQSPLRAELLEGVDHGV
ncbi:MAG: isocitrate/isopropylmalate family dehydrogenase, partial [Holophagales bacterium]|nr:isocitrate/isopropylmalate family dehydrogenase [Holophagales bacterium]